jgi:hypothetical protein
MGNDDYLIRKAEETEIVLKEIGYQICVLQQQNQILKAKLDKLEKMHLLGTTHMLGDL